MKKLLAILLAALAFAIACTAGRALEPLGFGAFEPEPEARAMFAATATERLFDVELAAGDVPGFSIDMLSAGPTVRYWSSEAAILRLSPADQPRARVEAAPGSYWLDRGFTGIRFRGRGQALSHVKPLAGGGWETIVVERHPGAVWLEDLHVVCGLTRGIYFGLKHPERPVEHAFKLATRNVLIDAPITSTVWPVFTYQAAVDMRDTTIDGRNATEHDFYGHGFAGAGIVWQRVRSTATAQGFKLRSDTSETVWARGLVTITGCTFDSWYLPRTWRGGGGTVFEGPGGDTDVAIVGNLFRNLGAVGDVPSSQRTRAIMVDDGTGDFWGTGGAPRTGHAAGHILIRGNGIETGPGSENLSLVVRVGNLGTGPWSSCKSLRIQENAIYGRDLQLQLTHVPTGKLRVEGNNTPALEALARRYGFDTTHQAKIPLSTRVAPLSEGLIR